MGTRTSFYGFTAFSLTQSLLSLGGRGFRQVPVGKVSGGTDSPAVQTLRKQACGQRGTWARVWREPVIGTGSVHTRAPGRQGNQTWGSRQGSPQPAAPGTLL